MLFSLSPFGSGWLVDGTRPLAATPVLPEGKEVGGPDRDRTGDLMNAIHGPGTQADWLSAWLSTDCRERAREAKGAGNVRKTGAGDPT